jgi:hypothetical protein
MSTTPNPTDLFLNMWSLHIHSDEGALPGTAEWDRAKMHRYWAKVWTDVKALTTYLEAADKLIEDVKTVINDPRPTPPCDPPGRDE